MENEKMEGLIRKNIQELRRGGIVIAVLGMLPEKKYGYQLLREMDEAGFSISSDTLYPLLRRLEEQETIDSEWIIDSSRPRKYYSINDNGRYLLQELEKEWENINNRIMEVLR